MSRSNIKCIARGSDSMENLATYLQEDLVQFCLVKIPLGSGTFKRNKYIYIHWVGPKCGIVKRGKWNAELPNVLPRFGSTHAGLEIAAKESITLDYVLSRLQKVFVADDGTFSLAALKEEYAQRVKEEEALAAPGSPRAGEAPTGFGEGLPTSPRRKRKLATELGLKEAAVLKAIREDFGPFNWSIFEPDDKKLVLVEAGSNGIAELCDELCDRSEKVLFGVFRSGFGTGRFRRTKRIFYHFIGEAAPMVAKGKWNQAAAGLMKALHPFNVDVRIQGTEEATLDAILRKLQDVFVMDDIKMPEGSSKPQRKEDVFSQEEYVKALLEEQEKTAEFYQEPPNLVPLPTAEALPAAPTEFDVDETVTLVHADEGGVGWAVFNLV